MAMHMTVAGQSFDVTGAGSFTSAHEADLSVNLTLPAASSIHSMQLRMVLAGDMIYEKFPPSVARQMPGRKPWIYMNLDQLGKLAGIPGIGSAIHDESSLNDPGQYLDFLRGASNGSIQNLGQQTVNGVQTTHYQADINPADPPRNLPASDRRVIEGVLAAERKQGLSINQMPVNAWIDSSDLVRRIELSYNASAPNGPMTMTMTENFLSYGPQPAPTIPAADETTNILSLLPKNGLSQQGTASPAQGNGCGACSGERQQAPQNSLAAAAS
ncbi:MAG TPA: hypothetical protein VME01_03840 [Solirubrobacteraceae bacterium]|nr:hypothetical protein [Solirubrobacteraceae bacterium]